MMMIDGVIILAVSFTEGATLRRPTVVMLPAWLDQVQNCSHVNMEAQLIADRPARARTRVCMCACVFSRKKILRTAASRCILCCCCCCCRRRASQAARRLLHTIKSAKQNTEELAMRRPAVVLERDVSSLQQQHIVADSAGRPVRAGRAAQRSTAPRGLFDVWPRCCQMQLAASVSSAHLERRRCAGFMVVEVEEQEEKQ